MMYVHQLFEEQVLKTPDAIAVNDGNQQLTYAELNGRAEVLKNAILAHSSNVRVIGISTTRGIDTIVGVIATIKAGKACLPIDPNWPLPRLAAIVADCSIDICLCHAGELPFFQSLGIGALSYSTIIIPSGSKMMVRHQKLAYVLYISGASGNPKGIAMGHEALVNLIQWNKATSTERNGARTLQFATLAVDTSFQEIFTTLSTGGELVLVTDRLIHEPDELLHYLVANGVNRVFIPIFVLQLLAETAVALQVYPQELREVITSGEQLRITPAIARFFSEVPATLTNQYGPAECQVVTSITLPADAAQWPPLPSVGYPLSNVDIYIVDDQLNLAEKGTAGEIYIGGVCLAEGYINNQELTFDRFIFWEHPNKGLVKIFRSGDVGALLPDGSIQLLGRKDEQLKLLGFTVEPAEIEAVLNSVPGVKQGVVRPFERNDGARGICAYLVTATAEEDTAVIREAIEARLPLYMMPTAFIWLPKLPISINGKIDKQSLPAPGRARPNLAVPLQAPNTDTERSVLQAFLLVLDLDEVGTADNFFEIGGDSLQAMKLAAALRDNNQIKVSYSEICQHPTVARLALVIEQAAQVEKIAHVATPKMQSAGGDIAIIGMASRFPGADTLAQLWEILVTGQETIHFFSEDELSTTIHPKQVAENGYVSAKGWIPGCEMFDASFFNMDPALAALMDPQQRALMELSWEVLEHSGYMPRQYEGRIGVFAGTGINTYFGGNVAAHERLVNEAGRFEVLTCNEKDYVASRIAYALGLKGPVLSIQSGDATAAVAIIQAAEQLRTGSCEMAIAGAANISLPLIGGYWYEEGGILSPDGHSRPFDAQANGTVWSDGAGLVLLKRLDDARRDGDHIFAVIKGVGISSDATHATSFLSPSGSALTEAIGIAANDAGSDLSGIHYIEGNGLANQPADCLEIAALRSAMVNDQSEQPIFLGSIKANIGHLGAASGIAGFIKAVLVLGHREVPAQINYHTAHPYLMQGDTRLNINTEQKKYDGAAPMRAGVVATAVGGTQAFLMLEEYKLTQEFNTASKPYNLFCWSAANDISREAYGRKLGVFAAEHPEVSPLDIAYSLHKSRAGMRARRYIIAETTEELASQLESARQLPANSNTITTPASGVVFMFPGQGAQYVNMGLGLYRHEPVFKATVDECAALLLPLMGEDIRNVLYPSVVTDVVEQKINNTKYTQPAIFVIEYALARLWMSWGVHPAAFAGHSVGEFVAGLLAGIFTLQEALTLVAERGRLIATLPEGDMLAVKTSFENIVDMLPPSVSLAAINSTNACVVAGNKQDISAFNELLREAGIACRLLATSHAFHSAMMDPMLKQFAHIVSRVQLRRPSMPLISSVTGLAMTDAEATDPSYWAKQIRVPVNFAQTANTLVTTYPGYVMLELGPGNATSTLVKQNSAGITVLAVAALGTGQSQSAYYASLHALGQVWLAGIEPTWMSIYAGGELLIHQLPTYAFHRQRFWVAGGKDLVNWRNYQLSAESSLQVPATITEIDEPEPILDIAAKVKQMIEMITGMELKLADIELDFAALGFDSLTLMAIVHKFRTEFGGMLSLYSLMEQLQTPLALNEWAQQQVKLGTASHPEKTVKRRVTDPDEQSLHDHLDGVSFMPDVKRQQVPAFTQQQARFIAELADRYKNKTRGSLSQCNQAEKHLESVQFISGADFSYRDLFYPLVISKSSGSHIWDIDGNHYIDTVSGFGSNLLGHQPTFIKDAIHAQIDKDYSVGAVTELNAKLASWVCHLTGMEKVAFCTTASEAIIMAVRMARSVTRRMLIVIFAGSCHGMNDELTPSMAKLANYSLPSWVGDQSHQVLVLEYGSSSSLERIRKQAHDIAAVLVEPVQMSNLQQPPIDFLNALKAITTESSIPLVFDETYTGFRVHPGGIQELTGVRADICVYGNGLGGGLPIAALAASRQLFDSAADAIHATGLPRRAFTDLFVAHPLALAASVAALEYLAKQGAQLQQMMLQLTERLVTGLNDVCREFKLPKMATNIGSIWKLNCPDHLPGAGLLYIAMRESGIYIVDGQQCFLSAAHTRGEVDVIISAFKDSVTLLLHNGFFGGEIGASVAKASGKDDTVASSIQQLTQPEGDDSNWGPPIPGARQGLNPQGMPAWFVPDPDRQGKYLILSF